MNVHWDRGVVQLVDAGVEVLFGLAGDVLKLMADLFLLDPCDIGQVYGGRIDS